jgi:hypothetical protein
MANVNVVPEGLVPELGDIWTFLSTVHKQTFGKIIYRDGSMIRIQQYNGSMIPVEFALDPASGFFLEQLGVTDIICHEKRKTPHFSLQLGVVEGENLELYTVEGLPIDSDKLYTIARVIADEESDAIELTDGTVFDFGFIGPPEGIGLITVAPAEDAEPENNGGIEPDIEAEPVDAFPAFDESLLPAALVEEIPTEERMYSDTIQRTDMFTSLYMDVPTRKQKDPKVMARLYRITDLLLALKNSVVVRDSNEAIIIGKHESYIAETVEESLEKQPTGAPIAALMPVAAVKRVIYTDDVSAGLEDKGDVESRSDINSLVAAIQASAAYNSAEAAGNPFIAYINTLMKTVEVFKASESGNAKITVDQDVFRTQLPNDPLMGLKDVPSVVDRKNEPQPLFADRHLTEVKDRVVRLLSSSRIRNPITGTSYLVAQADSGETVGHVVLDINLAKYRAPTRSSVLLWDIQASETSRKITTLFADAYRSAMDDQLVLPTGSDNTSLAEQLEVRIDSIINFVNRSSVEAMDSLGLRNLEISSDQFEHLISALKRGTSSWMKALSALEKSAETRKNAETTEAIPGIINEESGLMSIGTLGDETLQPIANDINEVNSGSVLENYDLVYANELTKYANYTLGPYYYGIAAGGADSDHVEKTRAEFKREEDRLVRNKGTALSLAAEFRAEPELIDCPHVDDLERVYNIREDDKRMLAFDKIVKKYNGGQAGNFILCGTCGNHLICKHELLLLNEFLHPGRSVALHKALLLEFGNGVFEGSYICKNCGQKIADLEYDTHLEFDDEGRPLVGRAVIDAPEDEGGESFVIADETDAAIPFTDKTDKAYYKLARSMFERVGLQPTEEMYKRVVPAARLYMETRMPSQKRYDKQREDLIAARKPAPTEYKHFYADAQAGLISALVLLELQTSSIEVPLPIPGADFSRAGFPVDGYDWNVVGMKALDYIAFGLAGLFMNTAPWNVTTWAPMSRPKERIKMAKTAIVNGVYWVLALKQKADGPRPLPLGTFTDLYEKRISAWREKKADEGAATAAAGASVADRLPPIFRPLPRAVSVSATTAAAIGNRNTYLEQLQTGDFSTVAPAMVARSHIICQQIMNDFHRSATGSAVVIAGSPRSDSTCCFTRIGAAAKKGMGVASLDLDAGTAAELELHAHAERLLHQRDPAAPAAGTHIYVPWSAPYSSTVLPEPKMEDYYKLFLKNCFAGDNMGLPHELNPAYECRHCGFEYPSQLMYAIGSEIPINADEKTRVKLMESMSAQYTALAIEALSTRVSINEESFRALEARVRERRQVAPITPPAIIPMFRRFAAMGEDLGDLLPSAAAEWTLVTNTLREMADESVTDIMERRGRLAPFASRYDALLTAVRGALNAAAGTRVEKESVDLALESLGKITENAVGAVNARNIMQLFVVYGEQIADNYNNKNPKPAKWFVKISYSHSELIQRIWNTVAEITTKRLEDLKRVDASLQDVIRSVLRRFTGWLGRWMNIWINEFRPSAEIHESELTLLLRWTVLNGFAALLTRNSPMYEGTTSQSSARATSVKFLTSWILDALITAAQRVDTYQLTADQIAEKLNERAEMERAAFLKKFDDLDLDLRKVELIKKKLKIGDWSVGATKNLFSYDANMFEFERDQRAAFGVPDFEENITGIRVVAAEQGGEMYGFRAAAPEGVNMHENLLDVDDGERDERN